MGLLNPLTIAVLLVFISLLTRRIWPRVIAITLILICSNPLVANFLLGSLEKKYDRVAFHDLPKMDTLLVLSGMVERIQNSDGSIDYEFNEAVDRINAGIEVMRLGKADKLILTQGFLPWSRGEPEGEFLKKVAIESGIPQKQIKLTNIVENTEQEFLELRNNITKDDVIGLITSAFHMQRALMHMSKITNDVVIIPVDYRSTSKRFTFIDFLPSPAALYKTTLFLKEKLGILHLKFLSLRSGLGS